MNFVTIGLSIYAAILSTILVIIRVREYQLTSRLLVEAYVEPPFDCLNISVTNNGTRPVTVAALTLRYGNQKLAAGSGNSDHLFSGNYCHFVGCDFR